jgi:hypothetical protein
MQIELMPLISKLEQINDEINTFTNTKYINIRTDIDLQVISRKQQMIVYELKKIIGLQN